jgi:hypothetical protein
MKNILKQLKGYFLLLTVVSILLPLSLSANTGNWIAQIPTDTTKVDTISKQVINIYLAKGLEARKLVLVLRERIQLDSQIISTKDTIIKQYQLVDREWSSKYKQKEKELSESVKRENTEYFWKRVFQVTTVFFGVLFLAN